jgi:hypothetical protein
MAGGQQVQFGIQIARFGGGQGHCHHSCIDGNYNDTTHMVAQRLPDVTRHLAPCDPVVLALYFKGREGGDKVAVIRLWLLIIAVQLVFYALLRVYVRSQQVERLENRWDARHPDQAGDSALRQAFIAKAMAGFEKTLRARLTLLVFVLPTLAVLGIVYLVN